MNQGAFFEEENENTVVATSPTLIVGRAATFATYLQGAMALGRLAPTGRISALLDAHGSLLGVFPFAQKGSATALVLGRHTHANARLANALTSLRHVLLFSPPSSALVLALDMRSSIGTAMAWGQNLERAVFRSTFALRLGGATLVVTDGGALEKPHLVAEAWATSLPVSDPTLPTSDWLLSLSPAVAGHTESRNFGRDFRSGETVIHPSGGLRVGGEWHVLDKSHLLRGFLIGRSGRCDAPGEQLQTSTLSRVHAAVFAFGSEVWLVDTASSNGIAAHNASRVSVVRVEEGLTLSLGTALRLEMRRRQ